MRYLFALALIALISAPAAAQSYADWYRSAGWGSSPPPLDPAGTIAVDLAQPYIAAGAKPVARVPSARALALADAMVDFRQPGLPGLTFGEYYLAATLDAAGIDADAEWLVALNRRTLARDWAGALAQVKARGGGATSTDPASLEAARQSGRAEVKSAVASALSRF